MAHNCYVTKEMTILDGAGVFNYGAAIALQKQGECLVDARSGLLLVTGKNKPVYSMQMFCNYIRSLRRVLTIEKCDNGLALSYMGFIPILCEPSFTNGAYANYLTGKLEASGLPLYRRPPMSFCGRPCDFAGTDIWVHRVDCVDILNLKCRPEHINARMIYEALGVKDFESDVRTLFEQDNGV